MTTLEARTATDSQRSPGPRRHEPKELTRGTTIGRYVVLEQLGQGGMGIVYAAWDFVLERRIALKLLHATGRVAPESGAQALVREAQVMARLAHPGINAVYDVGTFEGRTFLAMELADAGSLSAWLRRTPRSADQVLPLLLQAGQGLAAAHRANIAHGDFKPQNVLLTRDGRARVTDFGLAGEALATARLDEPQAGTPPYMAPERLAGGSVSAAADQYSYAVTLYEALCGRRPFGGASVGDLDASIRRGPPAVERLPRTVRSAVLRALAPDPAARFASMDALLEALDPRRPHQRRNAALAVAAAVVLVGVGYARGRLVPSEAPCGGGDQALSRVFTPVRLGTLPPAARAEVQAWGSRWKSAFVSACEATHVQKTQSPAVLDLRMRCLEGQLRAVDRLMTELDDTRRAEQAVSAAQSLRGWGACQDGPHLARWRPQDAEREAAAVALRTQLDALRALHATGQYLQVRERAEPLDHAVQAARDDYLLSELEWLWGDALVASSSRAEAVPVLQRALLAAERTGDERLGALVHLSTHQVTSEPLASEHLQHAEALVARMGGDARLELKIRVARGHGLISTDPERAAKSLEDAVAFGRRTLPADDLQLITAISALGTALLHADHPAQAVPHLEEALERTERLLGPRHPAMLSAIAPLSTVLLELGRNEEGLALARRAVAIAEATAQPGNFRSSYVLTALGTALMANGRFAEARTELERVVALDQSPGHSAAKAAWLNIAEALRAEGRPHEALAAYRRAEDIALQAGGRDRYLVGILSGTAEALLDLSRPAEALAQARRAVAVCSVAACGPLRAVALTSLGNAQLQTGAVALARRTLDEAVRQLTDEGAQPPDLACARFALARVMAKQGERAQARALAEAAAPVLARHLDYARVSQQLAAFLQTL